MWGCDYFPFSSFMGGGFTGGILSVLLWGLVILLLVFLAVKLFRLIKPTKSGYYRDRSDSLDILKMRYAKGEINQDEYFKMKNSLLKA